MFSKLQMGSLLGFMAAIFPIVVAQAADIERPAVQMVDKFNVNVATGQVSAGANTVSIGGAMGLSHSVSVHANEFNFLHNFGYNDKYWAETRYVHLSSVAGNPIPNVLRIFDPSGSADFRVYVNGTTPVLDFYNTPQPYTYAPVGDERHSLVATASELIWTKPDGTVVKFYRAANATAGATGLMKEIDYPNGFTVSIAVLGLQSVNTNTGFQLKYLYVADNRPMEKTDKPQLVNAPPLATSFQSGWSNRNPASIVAINNAVEYCAPTATTCALSNTWPTATFDWPAGMPRTMFIGDSQARITGPDGGVTKFDFHAYDLAEGGPTNPVIYPPDTEYSPRLVAVTTGGSTLPQYTYTYKNLFITNSVPYYTLNYDLGLITSAPIYATWTYRAQTAGVIKTATHLGQSIGYTLLTLFTDNADAYFNYGIGGGVNRVFMVPSLANGARDLISYADTQEGTIRFEATARNWPYGFEKLTGPWENYEYTRGNLTKITEAIDGVWKVRTEAHFPPSCTPATQKICNRADWIKDARGNTTYYTYHAPSGQVESVTLPPNKNGLAAQLRYVYEQKNAYFYQGGGTKVAGSPAIWVKTAEKYCINSAFTSGACGSGGEVVTAYEYNDNLLLKGMTVTAPVNGVSQTLRTCFQYDIYGNQIGRIEPNANLASCN